jgi:hypothetical protein
MPSNMDPKSTVAKIAAINGGQVKAPTATPIPKATAPESDSVCNPRHQNQTEYRSIK